MLLIFPEEVFKIGYPSDRYEKWLQFILETKIHFKNSFTYFGLFTNFLTGYEPHHVRDEPKEEDTYALVGKRFLLLVRNNPRITR